MSNLVSPCCGDEKCEEFFEASIEEHEYKNQMLDAKAEDRSEADRDES